MENDNLDPLITPVVNVETTPTASTAADPILPPMRRQLPVKKFRLIILSAVVAVVLVAAVAISAAVYLLPVNDSFVRSVTSVVPYPIVMVNAQPITFKEFYIEWDAMQKYLQGQTAQAEAPSIEEMRNSIIETMISKAEIRQLAKQYKVVLDPAKVDQMTQQVLAQYDSEEAALTVIKNTFGWDKQLFIERVIKPVVLSSQLQEAVFADNSLQATAKNKIDGALQRLKNGETFAAVATEVSEDPTSASQGGDIGFVTVDAVPAEWISAAVALGLNQFSDVIDLGSVYSIVSASEKTESVDEGTKYHFQIIIVQKYSLDKFLESFTTSSKIWRFFKTV
ncbi:MAG: peptidylprolyl isomerase [Candidatus Uhrbacteria bacterium]